MFKTRKGIVMDENIIICPNCSRKLSIIRKDGDIRKEIHCRCRDKYGHTMIQWVSGAGYHYFSNEMELIPVIHG